MGIEGCCNYSLINDQQKVILFSGSAITIALETIALLAHLNYLPALKASALYFCIGGGISAFATILLFKAQGDGKHIDLISLVPDHKKNVMIPTPPPTLKKKIEPQQINQYFPGRNVPRPIFEKILSFLEASTIKDATLVSKSWHAAIRKSNILCKKLIAESIYQCTIKILHTDSKLSKKDCRVRTTDLCIKLSKISDHYREEWEASGLGHVRLACFHASFVEPSLRNLFIYVHAGIFAMDRENFHSLNEQIESCCYVAQVIKDKSFQVAFARAKDDDSALATIAFTQLKLSSFCKPEDVKQTVEKIKCPIKKAEVLSALAKNRQDFDQIATLLKLAPNSLCTDYHLARAKFHFLNSEMDQGLTLLEPIKDHPKVIKVILSQVNQIINDQLGDKKERLLNFLSNFQSYQTELQDKIYFETAKLLIRGNIEFAEEIGTRIKNFHQRHRLLFILAHLYPSALSPWSNSTYLELALEDLDCSLKFNQETRDLLNFVYSLCLTKSSQSRALQRVDEIANKQLKILGLCILGLIYDHSDSIYIQAYECVLKEFELWEEPWHVLMYINKIKNLGVDSVSYEDYSAQEVMKFLLSTPLLQEQREKILECIRHIRAYAHHSKVLRHIDNEIPKSELFRLLSMYELQKIKTPLFDYCEHSWRTIKLNLPNKTQSASDIVEDLSFVISHLLQEYKAERAKEIFDTMLRPLFPMYQSLKCFDTIASHLN